MVCWVKKSPQPDPCTPDEIATIALQCELEAEAKVKGKQVMGLFFTHNSSKEDKDSSLKLDKDIESRLKNIVERPSWRHV